MVRLVDRVAGRSADISSLVESVIKVIALRSRCFSLTSMLLVAFLLSACSGNGKKWNPEDYTVKSGDTIYSIAWRYELDPEDFAAWNGKRSSQFIKPGERLHTRKPAGFDATRKTDVDRSIAYAPQATTGAGAGSAGRNLPDQSRVKAEKGDTLYSLSKRYGVSVERLAQLNQLKKPYIIQPGQTIFLKPLNTATRSSTSQAVTGSNSAVRSQQQPVSWPSKVKWQRPADGKIVKKFNRQRNDAKGLDIAGKRGDAIVAAAGGKVVYSGNGLISYGNLIIIKHNKTYLSAYAYNQKLLVKEGEVVKAGQKIAEMGHKDKLSPRLHFEIRRNGKPVDPMKYLPW